MRSGTCQRSRTAAAGGKGGLIGFDTLHAAKTLTDAGIDAARAKAIVAALSEAVGEPTTRADLEPVATRANTRADLGAA